MNCRMCGHLIESNVRYCPMCGMDRYAQRPVHPDEYIDAQKYWSGLKKREKFLFFLIFAAVGIIVAAVVFNIWFVHMF